VQQQLWYLPLPNQIFVKSESRDKFVRRVWSDDFFAVCAFATKTPLYPPKKQDVGGSRHTSLFLQHTFGFMGFRFWVVYIFTSIIQPPIYIVSLWPWGPVLLCLLGRIFCTGDREWGYVTQQDTLYYALFSVHITMATMHAGWKLQVCACTTHTCAVLLWMILLLLLKSQTAKRYKREIKKAMKTSFGG